MIYVVGCGYVGLVTGLGIAKRTGKNVTFVEQNASRVEDFKKGKLPFFEPGLPELWDEVSRSGRIDFCNDIAKLSLTEDSTFFICVGTPQKPTGEADLRFLNEVGAALKAKLTSSPGRHYILVKSTVPPGTTDEFRARYFAGSSKIHVGMNPEFLREGCAVKDFLEPDRIVLGVDCDACWKHLSGLYGAFAPVPIVRCSSSEAELIKYSNNALLATLISFSNEIALLSGHLEGADPYRVLSAVLQDKRWQLGKNGLPDIAAYLKPGCGFGGSCFPKDLAALSTWAKAHQVPTPIIWGAGETNHNIQEALFHGVREALGKSPGRAVTVLGIAFKSDTDDTRESVGLELIRKLGSEGMNVKAHDPQAKLPADITKRGNVVQVADLNEALRDSHCVVLATAWPQYRTLNESSLLKHKVQVVVDGRGFWDPQSFTQIRYLRTPFGRWAEPSSVRKVA